MDDQILSKLNKILIIKFRHLGDVLLTSSLITRVKKLNPDIKIDVLVYADTKAMLEDHEAINEVYVVDKQWKKLTLLERLKNELKVFFKIRSENYGMIINLTEGDRGAWVSLLSNATYRLGPRHFRKENNFLHKLAYTKKYSTDRRYRHIVEQNLDSLRSLGVKVPMNEEKLSFRLDSSLREGVLEKLKSSGWKGGKFLILHPTSRWFFKCIPAVTTAKFIEVVKKQGYEVVITSGPAENEISMVNDILDNCCVDLINLSGQLSLKELGHVVNEAELFAGSDSLPMHMAAALSVPVLVWFGPSYDVVWGPWLVKHKIVSLNMSCRPCGLDGCGGGKLSECLEQLPITKIESAFLELIKLDA